MFWAYNTTSPQIDIILCKEDLALQELLDQENVLQELKAQNLKLVEFLLKPEILRELVTLITTEPSPNIDEAEQYKYPNLACELLTSDLPAINERLASEEILNKLYCFLENEPPLNPLLSSYFSRTLSILISRKSERNWYSYQYTCLQALEFLKAKKEFMELLLKHMGTSSIMDLMHNLVTLIEGPELKQSLRSWLQSQNVIPNLIGLLRPSSDAACQVNAASVLCSILQKLRENMADLNEKPEFDPILNLLESPLTIRSVLLTVFGGDSISETSIESAIDVLLALLQPYLNGEARCRQMLNYTVHDKMDSGLIVQNNFCEPQSPKREHEVPLADIAPVILPFIKEMKDVLQNPIRTEPVTLTSGIISPPFGKARLLVAKFIAVLISLNNVEINTEIIHCDIPELLLDFFYAYSSNNFLHTEVEKLIAYVIDNFNDNTAAEDNDDMFVTHLLKKCNLVQRILNMWNENAAREKEGHFRRGYMGHVIRIASLMHIEDAKLSSFHELIVKEVSENCLEDWNEFVNEKLRDIMKLHTSCLGGVRPKSGQSSDNSFEEAVYKEMKSPFKEYDQEDDQNVIFSNDIMSPESDADERRLEMFTSICAQKWQSFNELNSLDDNEESERINVWKSKMKTENSFRNWDSDDENCDEDDNSSNPWAKLGNVTDPWSNSSNDSTDNTKWDDSDENTKWNANISDDIGWANFDENFTNGSSSLENGTMETHSTLATNMEAYSLFGNSGQQNSGVVNTFSNMNISDEKVTFDSHFNDIGEPDKIENSPFDLQNEYDCYDDDGKDSSEEMLNLESICGDTLAEKLANAENDIRNKDEILMRGMQEQGAMRNNFRMPDKAELGGDKIELNSSVDVDYDSKLIGGDEYVEEETLQAGAYMSQPDCLTENSVDFMTAENSTSDAESSVEFDDAENSLEFEADDLACDKEEIENGRSASHDSNANLMPSQCKECAEIVSENVPKGDAAEEECNKSVVEAKVDAEIVGEKTYLLVNGDVGQLENQSACDNTKDDASDQGGKIKEQMEKGIIGATTIEETV